VIDLKDKELAMEKLSQIPSDLLPNTKAYCRSALPDPVSKQEIWDGLLGTKYDDLSLLDHESLCDGVVQRSHYDILPKGF
jgi:hypothetical protein